MGNKQQSLPNPTTAPSAPPQPPLPYHPQMQQFPPSPIAVSAPADPTQAYYVPGYHTPGYVQGHDGYGNPIFIQQHEYQQPVTYPVPYSSSYPPHPHPHLYHHNPHSAPVPAPAHVNQTWHQHHYRLPPHQQQQAPWSQYHPQQMSPANYGAAHPPAPAVPAQKPFTPRVNLPENRSDPSLSTTYPSSSNASTPSLPRGPPRKPKKSGNGLWVGNLPPGTTVGDLKEYFSQGAKTEIQSVYLISKSNCAFINYRSDAALLDAMQRFHDSRFKNTRLVCRTQRPEAEKFPGGSPSVPTPPTPATEPATTPVEAVSPPALKAPPSGPSGAVSKPRVYGKDRYFIVKSLTVEDMDFSVKNGIWATQGHNETALNQAFETAENVYLIFSANKSGEYFGYARMISTIDSSTPQLVPALPSSTATPLPKAIVTPETDAAPKGCIYDDSARGSIFWEADSIDDPTESSQPTPDNEPLDPVPASAGTPFKVQWLSTNRIPFYRCRNMRNPWNANREVKVARDGTELETALGQRLVAMFHRPGVNVAAVAGSAM